MLIVLTGRVLGMKINERSPYTSRCGGTNQRSV